MVRAARLDICRQQRDQLPHCDGDCHCPERESAQRPVNNPQHSPKQSNSRLCESLTVNGRLKLSFVQLFGSSDSG
eukprot:1085178-Amphidinium_carterae.2